MTKKMASSCGLTAGSKNSKDPSTSFANAHFAQDDKKQSAAVVASCAVHFLAASSPGFAKQIIRGSIRKKIPAFRLRLLGFGGQAAGMTPLKLGVLGGYKQTLCSLQNSVSSVTHKTAEGITKQPQMHTHKHEWRRKLFGFIRVYSWLKKSKDPSTSFASAHSAQYDKKNNVAAAAPSVVIIKERTAFFIFQAGLCYDKA